MKNVVNSKCVVIQKKINSMSSFTRKLVNFPQKYMFSLEYCIGFMNAAMNTRSLLWTIFFNEKKGLSWIVRISLYTFLMFTVCIVPSFENKRVYIMIFYSHWLNKILIAVHFTFNWIYNISDEKYEHYDCWCNLNQICCLIKIIRLLLELMQFF